MAEQGTHNPVVAGSSPAGPTKFLRRIELLNMCGFVGFTGQVPNRLQTIQKMADRIAHRGPDGEGFFVEETDRADCINLGHRRLSIIDLEGGDQPIFNEDKSVVVVFNGEIYNFQEIKTELSRAGHVFKTNCDTEVLVHGWEEFGRRLVDKLRGMFAFAIFDTKTRTLFCARDHFGIKPFYYAQTEDGNLLFGSEIKSFLEHPQFRPEVNSSALLSYLTLQYNAQEETFFKGVYKLKPAHTLTFKDGVLETSRFWDVDFYKKQSVTYEECAAQIDSVVRESVDAHRIADVEVGAYLSGGVDSSYVTAVQMPQRTFSVGFEQKQFDETNDAAALSKILGIKNSTIHITAEDCMSKVERIQYFMDEPASNLSAMPLFYLSKLAASDVKVVLSGEGADEIYGGYEWYVDAPAMAKYKRLPAGLRKSVANWARGRKYFRGQGFLEKGSGRPEDYFIGQALVFEPDDAKQVLRNEFRDACEVKDITSSIYSHAQGLSELEKKQYLDFHMWLPGDILLKGDKMSMAHSLELRVPYLDKVLVEHAQTIPAEFKTRDNVTKAVLRSASIKTLPQEWVNRPKKGFPVPIIEWLRQDEYYDMAKSAITSEVSANYFNVDELLALLEAHKAGKANNHRKIWTVFVFLSWHKAFFGD